MHGYYGERLPAFLQESEALLEGGLEAHARAYLSGKQRGRSASQHFTRTGFQVPDGDSGNYLHR